MNKNKAKFYSLLLFIVILVAFLLIVSFHLIPKKESDNITNLSVSTTTITTTTTTTNNTEDQTIDNAFSAWISYWDFQNGVTSYSNNPEVFISISPTWYFVQSDGSIGLRNTARGENLRLLAQENSTKLIPSINNSSAEALSNILNSPSLRNVHINSILNEIETYGYDGIDIDYELMLSTDTEEFTLFLKELSEKLHHNNKVLTIAILWKTNVVAALDQFSSTRSAQNWSGISKYVDEFRIMAYDYTGSDKTEGPIAPIYWIEDILKYAVAVVPNEKIVLGLPLYAYKWNDGNTEARALVWEDVQLYIQNNDCSDTFDINKQEKKLICENDIIWYQDKEATESRIELANSYGIYKFVFWRLGGEDPTIWALQSNN